MAKRFGQGNEVDRFRPHIFHRDYLPLKAIRQGVEDFAHRYENELKGGRVLDYGAGQSPYRPVFDELGITLLPADINPKEPGILPIDEAGHVPLPDASLDAIVSTQVLEHVPEVARYLAEGKRLLRPGGLFYLSTHGTMYLHRHPTDMWRWTIDGLRYEMERAGFKVESVTPRIGMLATATHLRAILIGGLTRRVPCTGWLRPVIYFIANVRMMLNEFITPATALEALQELLLIVGRKPPEADAPAQQPA